MHYFVHHQTTQNKNKIKPKTKPKIKSWETHGGKCFMLIPIWQCLKRINCNYSNWYENRVAHHWIDWYASITQRAIDSDHNRKTRIDWILFVKRIQAETEKSEKGTKTNTKKKNKKNTESEPEEKNKTDHVQSETSSVEWLIWLINLSRNSLQSVRWRDSF